MSHYCVKIEALRALTLKVRQSFSFFAPIFTQTSSQLLMVLINFPVDIDSLHRLNDKLVIMNVDKSGVVANINMDQTPYLAAPLKLQKKLDPIDHKVCSVALPSFLYHISSHYAIIPGRMRFPT